jgi:hypothetical protein
MESRYLYLVAEKIERNSPEIHVVYDRIIGLIRVEHTGESPIAIGRIARRENLAVRVLGLDKSDVPVILEESGISTPKPKFWRGDVNYKFRAPNDLEAEVFSKAYDLAFQRSGAGTDRVFTEKTRRNY